MYGSGVGTGVAGGGILGLSIASGSTVLMVVVGLLMISTSFVLLRNARRTASNKRP